MKKELFFILILLISMTGCASKLVVYSANDNPNIIKGIRVYAPASYILTKEIETERCPPKTEESIIHLPHGDAYDITFESAPFAKSEFSVIFNDNGLLKQVTLNSTPQVADTIKALGELTEKISAAVVPLTKIDCGAVTRETVKSVKRLKVE